jgi:hypothetical protein
VEVNDHVVFHLREVSPKDFYFAQVLRQSERSQIALVERLIVNPEVLDEASSADTRKVIAWVCGNLLDGTVLTVENWLEIAFHLCKQRWDQSVDWLELQPMSKINAMISVMKNHAEEQEKLMKKSRKK